MARPGGPARAAFDRVSFWGFKALRACVNLLPWGPAYVLADLLAAAWWLLDEPHRSLALDNLAIAFPALHPARRRRMAFASFRQLCWVLVETLRTKTLTRETWNRRVTLVNDERFERARARGRGVIAVSAHLGNWEWLSAHALRHGEVAIVARAIHNPLMDREIRKRREDAGVRQVYPTRESPRDILRILRDGGSLCFLVDQSAKGEEGAEVPFFGRPAPTHTGPAVLAQRSGAPVIPVFARRGPDRRIFLEYGAELRLADSGDRARDTVENTALFTRVVEEAVRRSPEQWFWVHDRWRIRKRRRAGRKPASSPGTDREPDPSSRG